MKKMSFSKDEEKEEDKKEAKEFSLRLHQNKKSESQIPSKIDDEEEVSGKLSFKFQGKKNTKTTKRVRNLKEDHAERLAKKRQ
jgi:hypothetical protein